MRSSKIGLGEKKQLSPGIWKCSCGWVVSKIYLTKLLTKSQEIIEFFRNVFTKFTEFSDTNNIILKKDFCIQTCYLLCKNPALYLSTREVQVTERIIKLNPIYYVSDFSDSLNFIESPARHLGKTRVSLCTSLGKQISFSFSLKRPHYTDILGRVNMLSRCEWVCVNVVGIPAKGHDLTDILWHVFVDTIHKFSRLWKQLIYLRSKIIPYW